MLCPEAPFPLDLLDLIRGRLRNAPESYLSRVLGHRGEDLQRRIAVVLRGPQPPDWIDAAREKAQVFRDQSAGDALREPEELGAALSGARITGPVTAEDFSALARRAEGESVVFADEALELQWTRRVLGFSDAR